MISVELVYDADCPAVADARKNLTLAMMKAGLPPSWTEVDRSSPMATWAKSYASPTILVNRNNVAGTSVLGDACAVYQSAPGKLAAVPPVPMIAAALSDALAGEQALASAAATKQGWLKDTLLVTLACLGCCLPLFAAGLSGVSLGFLLSSGGLLALVVVVLAITLTGLFLEGRRSGYGPFFLGVVSAAAILFGRLLSSSIQMSYPGLGLLAGAVGWSFLAHRRKAAACSPSCAPAGSSFRQLT